MSEDKRKPARVKQRTAPHMMEDASKALLRSALPIHWAIHDYAPDYGIDGAMEIFGLVDDGLGTAETLGEAIFFQLKSVAKTVRRSHAVETRFNVEKRPLEKNANEAREIDIHSFRIDTNELLTIEAMGSGISVLLFLACLDTNSVYFLNLTDYIDKVLSPESPDWREQQSKTIAVPLINELKPDTPLLTLLRFYGMRPKLTGMFTRVHFQWRELDNGRHTLSFEEWVEMAIHFSDRLLALNVWEYDGWELLGWYRGELLRIRDQLVTYGRSAAFRKLGPTEQLQENCIGFWFRMNAISNVYEDIAREWGLPTYLGLLSSYPDELPGLPGVAEAIHPAAATNPDLSNPSPSWLLREQLDDLQQ
jgi:hypothetical protein